MCVSWLPPSGTFMKAFDKTTDAAVAAIIYAGPAKQVDHWMYLLMR